MLWFRRRFLDPEPTDGGGGSKDTDANKGTEDTGEKTTSTYKVMVNGVEKEVSIEDLKNKFQKESAADEKFQAAAAAIKFKEDMELAQQGDEGAFRRVASSQGWTDDQISQALLERKQAEIRAAVGDHNPKGNPDPSKVEEDGSAQLSSEQLQQVAEVVLAVIAEKDVVGFNRLAPELQRVVGQLANSSWEGQAQAQIDSEAFLGKIMKDGSTKQKAALKDAVQNEARRRADAGEDITDSRIMQSVLKDVRHQLENLGVTPTGSSVTHPGLGSSGASGTTLYQGGNPPKRPTGGLSGPGADDYIGARLQELMSPEGPA